MLRIPVGLSLGQEVGDAEVEETLKRLQSQKGVQGIIVVNTEEASQDSAKKRGTQQQSPQAYIRILAPLLICCVTAQSFCCFIGIPIKSTMDNPTTTQYANLMHNFILKARSTVREIDPQNDLTFLRIRSKKNEIMVAPDKDYFLIVIQNPTE
ncbi:dynein light chain roadblock-type 1 isoform X1 [Panthera tigris]|uniref:dynein light chain roadblock-type 1 isoform X1 n=1 Tax=Panthera tigris TaxID=9694 RepID=UPI00042C0E4D|nr:dynein light chain roadblock-type 1 isoform X1 [Panthera tigris]